MNVVTVFNVCNSFSERLQLSIKQLSIWEKHEIKKYITGVWISPFIIRQFIHWVKKNHILGLSTGLNYVFLWIFFPTNTSLRRYSHIHLQAPKHTHANAHTKTLFSLKSILCSISLICSSLSVHLQFLHHLLFPLFLYPSLSSSVKRRGWRDGGREGGGRMCVSVCV